MWTYFQVIASEKVIATLIAKIILGWNDISHFFTFPQPEG